MCCVSPVTCHMSITPSATATEPFPANSPTMRCRLFCKERNVCLEEPAYPILERGSTVLLLLLCTSRLGYPPEF